MDTRGLTRWLYDLGISKRLLLWDDPRTGITLCGTEAKNKDNELNDVEHTYTVGHTHEGKAVLVHVMPVETQSQDERVP